MTLLSRSYSIKALFCLFGLSSLPVLADGDKSSIDHLWDYADLYKNNQGDYLKLSGRLHLDSAWFDGDQGEYSELTWRRLRFGFKGQYGVTTASLEGDFNLNNEFSDSYNRLTDANLSWNVDPIAKLTILKHSAGFTLDGKTSSKKLLTPQRNNLTNNLWFTAEYFTGVSLKGDFADSWSYKAGIFSTDDSDEIGFSQASYFSLLSLDKKFAKNTLWDKGSLHFDYVYNDMEIDSNTRSLSQVVSVSSKFQQGQWHLWSDIGFGEGALGQSNLWGAVIMPYYQSSDIVQWVARYTYLDSQDVNGLRLGRYENRIDEGRGDNYHELFGGVNFLMNSHKLKLHLGAQYAKMKDSADDGGVYDGWGLTLALRSYW